MNQTQCSVDAIRSDVHPLFTGWSRWRWGWWSWKFNGPRKTVDNKKTSSVHKSLKDVVLGAIYQDSTDRERRARSVIISGFKPPDHGSESDAVCRFLTREFDFDPGEVKCRRLGEFRQETIQPLLVSFKSREDATWLIANSYLLRKSRDSWTMKNIYINQKLSRIERQRAYDLRCKRRSLRSKPQFNVAVFLMVRFSHL